ncbi:MAG: DUF63 family protein [Candidatus Aenigmatarchaeota archaeon]|nr:MAG: DUF63 family protein [Candidatus Aenigmarchaeota archaeon]
MADVIQEYFINPILQNGWYNPVNTIVYSILLVIGVYLVYRMLKRMDVHIDSRFFLAILPFILWGSTTRVLHDAAYAGILSPELNAFYGSPIFPTPGSYIITFALALFVLLVSLLVQRLAKFPYWKTMLVIGIVLCIINFLILPIFYLFPIALIIKVTGLWAAVFFIPRKFMARYVPSFNKLFSIENTGILVAHFLDATATVTALTLFGYLEQHVVPRLFFPIMGPFAMFFLKVVVVLPVLWIVDRYAEEGDFKNFLKIVILILGLAPGLRDMIRLGVGV